MFCFLPARPTAREKMAGSFVEVERSAGKRWQLPVCRGEAKDGGARGRWGGRKGGRVPFKEEPSERLPSQTAEFRVSSPSPSYKRTYGRRQPRQPPHGSISTHGHHHMKQMHPNDGPRQTLDNDPAADHRPAIGGTWTTTVPPPPPCAAEGWRAARRPKLDSRG